MFSLRHVIEEQRPPDAVAGLAHQRRDRNVQRQRAPLVLQSLFIDAGDLLAVAARSDFRGEFCWQQRIELCPHCFLPRNAKKLLHPRVPAFHRSAQVHGKHAHVQRFHDVLAEVLQSHDLQCLLFKRVVKLRVVERHRYVSRDRFHQFHVVTRQEIAVHGLAKPQHRDAPLTNAARNVVIQVQLLQRIVHRRTHVACRARRLEKERPTRDLGPGRLKEAQIQRFVHPHAHRARQSHFSRRLSVLYKNCQSVNQQCLRNTVHHRSQHRIEPYFIGQSFSEFDQRAAIVQPVAIEEVIEPPLNPYADWLEQERRDRYCQDRDKSVARIRVEYTSTQSNQREAYRRNCSGRRRMRQSALEDDVHVHQAVADDRVPETQRNQHQAQRGKHHPWLLQRIEQVRKSIKKGERQAPCKGTARKPLQLLAQNARRRLAEVRVENQAGSDKTGGQITEFNLIEQYSRA